MDEDNLDENDQRQHRQVFGWFKDDETVVDAFTNLQVTSSYNALPCYTIGQRLVLRAKEENVKYLTVCIPCYNEDKEELYKTMLSLMQNADFCKKARCSDTPAGMSVEEEFQKTIFVLVPIFDGIRAMDDSMKAWLADNFKGVFDDLLYPDPAKNSKDIDPDEVVVRVACRRWWYYAHDVIPKASDTDEFQDEEELFEDHLIPFYMLPIVKKANHRKHNSHQWFFDCVCMALKKTCTYAFLTDCGTTYEPNCVAILFKEVIVHSSLIGVTARQRVEWPNKYYHPCENAPFSCWKGDHTASKSKKPCWKCYVSFFLSPCPLQGFEFEASLITNLSIFNLVEALPVMPGPCQLLNWQKMKHFQIVKEYFNLLFKAEVNKKQKIAVPTRYHKMIDDAEGEDDSEGEGENAQLLPSGVSRDAHTAEGGGVVSDDEDDDESEYEEYEEIEEFDYSLPQTQYNAYQFPSQFPAPHNAQPQYSAPRSRNSFASNADMPAGGYDQIYSHGGEVELAPYPYPHSHTHAHPVHTDDQHSLTYSKLGSLSVHSGVPPPPPPPRSLNLSSSPSMYGGMVIPPPPPLPSHTHSAHSHTQAHTQMHIQSPPTRGVRVVKRRRRIPKPPKPPKHTQPAPAEPTPLPAPAPGGHGHGGGEQKLTFTEFLRTNMRLAEDRVLSFVGVFSTRYGTKWVPGATFYYTPEITWQTLLLQRRRWINGTLASYFFFLLSRRAKARLNARTFDDQSSIKFMVLFLWRMQLFQLLLVFIAPAVFGSTCYASLIDCAKRFPSIFGWAADPLFPSREDSTLVVADLVVFIAFVLYAVWTISSHYLVGGRMPEIVCQIMATLGFIYMIPIYWSLYSAIIMMGISFVVILVFLSLFAPAIISIAESTKCMQLYVCYFPWFAALTVFFLILMPSYSLARLFDTSWGNRATGSDSAVAKHEEVTMKRWNIVFIVFIVGMNFAVTIGLQRILTAGYTAIMTVMIVVFVPSIVQLAGAILFWIKMFIQRNELNVPFLNDTSRTARRAAFVQLQQQKALQALLAKERERAQALETQLSALQQEHSSQQDTQSQHTGDDEEGGAHEEEEDEEVPLLQHAVQQPVQHMMPTQQHVQQLSRRPSFASVASVHTHTHSVVPPPPPPPPHSLSHAHAHKGFTQVPPPPPQQHMPPHNTHTQPSMASGVHEYDLSHTQSYAHTQPPPPPHTILHTHTPHNAHTQAPSAQQRRSFSLAPPPPINMQINGNIAENYPMSASPSAMKKMLADPSHAHNAHTQHLPMAQAKAIDDSHSVTHSLASSVAHPRAGTPRSLTQQKALSNALPPGFTETLITPHNAATQHTQHTQQQTQPSPLIQHHQQRLLGMHTQQTARPSSAKPLPPQEGPPSHHTSLPHMSHSAENLTHSTLTHPQTLAHSHSLNSLPTRHSSSPGTLTARSSFTQLPQLIHLSQTTAHTHVDSPRMALIRQRERELEKERESERERERQRERDIERLRAMEEEMAREGEKLRQAMNRVPSGDSHTLSLALSLAQSQAHSHALSQAHSSSMHSLSEAQLYTHAHAHAELAEEHSVEAVPVAVEVQAMPVSLSVSVDEKEGDNERESESSLFFSPLSAHTHDTEISERDNPMLLQNTHTHTHAYPQSHNGLWRSHSLSDDDGVSTSTHAEEKDSAGMVSERERSVRLALVTPQRETHTGSHTGSHTDAHSAEGGIAEYESPSPFASARLTPSTLARVFSNNAVSQSAEMASQEQFSQENVVLSPNGTTTAMLTLHLHDNSEDYEDENEESETIAHSALSQHSHHSQHSQSHSFKRVLRVGEEAERRASSGLLVTSSLSFSMSASRPVTPTHSRSRLLPAEFNSGLPLSVSIPSHEEVTERAEALHEQYGEHDESG